jgi:hypothetical protein
MSKPTIKAIIKITDSKDKEVSYYYEVVDESVSMKCITLQLKEVKRAT